MVDSVDSVDSVDYKLAMPATLAKKDKSLRKSLVIEKRIAELQRKLAALTEELQRQSSKPAKAGQPKSRAKIFSPGQQPYARIRKMGKTVAHGPKAGRFDPFEAGRKAVVQMQAAEGGAWTGAELESHYNLTPATLHKRRVEHRIVFWNDAKNQFHYPKWQFNEAGALWPGVQEVLQTFKSSDEWRVMRYFLAPRHQLDDRTPLDLLRAGQATKVIAHAKAHGEENSW
jgi:hypothetical protein